MLLAILKEMNYYLELTHVLQARLHSILFWFCRHQWMVLLYINHSKDKVRFLLKANEKGVVLLDFLKKDVEIKNFDSKKRYIIPFAAIKKDIRVKHLDAKERGVIPIRYKQILLKHKIRLLLSFKSTLYDQMIH